MQSFGIPGLQHLVCLIWVFTAATSTNADENTDSGRQGFYVSASVSQVQGSRFAGLLPASSVSDTGRQLALGYKGLSVGRAKMDVGIDYQYSRYEFDGIQGRDRDLHRFQVPVRLLFGDGEWRTEALIVPGLATSSNIFKDVVSRASGDDLTLAGRLVAERATETGTWFAGVAYDQTFGKPKTYPVVGMERDFSPSLRVRIAFPDPAAWIPLSERMLITARLYPAGQRWRVVTDDFSDDFDYRDEETRLQVTWSARLGERWHVDVGGGYAFNRRQVFTDDQALRLESTIEDAGFFAVGFRYGAAPLPYPNGSGF